MEKDSENNAELLRDDIDDFDNELNDFLMQLDNQAPQNGEPIIEDYFALEYNGSTQYTPRDGQLG